MDIIKSQNLRSLQSIAALSDNYASIAADPAYWLDDTPLLILMCGAWGLLFVDEFNSKSAGENTRILRMFNDALQDAWKNDYMDIAEALDEFASYLEEGIDNKKLPAKEILLEDVGTYLSNIVQR